MISPWYMLMSAYMGGSFVVMFFWMSNDTGSKEEVSLYRKMIFLWPVIAIAVMVYRLYNQIIGETDG